MSPTPYPHPPPPSKKKKKKLRGESKENLEVPESTLSK